MGSVIKGENNSWTAVYNCRIKGKRRWKRGFKTKKEARNYVDKQEDSSYVEESEKSFAEFCDYWIENHAKVNCQDSTLENYLPMINSHFKPFFDKIKLCQVLPRHILSYLGHLRNNTNLKEQTIYHHYRLLYNIFSKATQWGFLETNPVEKVDAPKVRDKYEYKIWDAEDLLKAINKLEREIIELPVLIAIFTGMRMGEILGLRHLDVDFKKDKIMVKHALGKINGNWSLEGNKN